MKRTQMRFFLAWFSLLLLVPMAYAEEERSDGYFTMTTSEGRIICRTAHQVNVGDEYLAADNRRYRVERIDGDRAIVRYLRQETASIILSEFSWGSMLKGLLMGEKRVQTGKKRPIAVFHTHTDESYVPSDGKSSIKAKGGIFQVGDSLSARLRKQGIDVIHDKTPHDPHDAMAYDRSRRTAVELLKKRPVAIIDVHRDAVPQDEYADRVNNTEVTKVQLVIGRQNPNRAANEAFAKQIKAVVDKKHPGLIKGIFYGKGKYNQDLAPRLILVEVGSHTNSKQAAERGAAIFASAAQEVIYNQGKGAIGGPIRRGSNKALLWIVGLGAAGAILFILLNSGGAGLKRFGSNIKEEFAGALTPEDQDAEEKNDEDKDHNPSEG